MSEVRTPAVPETVTFNCDKCGAIDIDVDARITTMDRDFQGGIVYSHTWHLCQGCRALLAEWMRETAKKEKRTK